MRKTVLITEDDWRLRAAYERALGRHFKVLVAPSVNFAIGILLHDMLENASIDVVVSDYDLGDGTGGDIYRWVQENRPGLPFFLCTGHQDVDLDVPIFTKPFDFDELRKAIEG